MAEGGVLRLELCLYRGDARLEHLHLFHRAAKVLCGAPPPALDGPAPARLPGRRAVPLAILGQPAGVVPVLALLALLAVDLRYLVLLVKDDKRRVGIVVPVVRLVHDAVVDLHPEIVDELVDLALGEGTVDLPVELEVVHLPHHLEALEELRVVRRPPAMRGVAA
eukprot:scaffold82830_cov67-Phaeocystis_antarctica.AAC.2